MAAEECRFFRTPVPLLHRLTLRFTLAPLFHRFAATPHGPQVNFSPDGRFIMSGDGEGRCWFWDWKTCKVFRTLKCHDSVCIGAEWHPLETSKVATCGWDGLIKYW